MIIHQCCLHPLDAKELENTEKWRTFAAEHKYEYSFWDETKALSTLENYTDLKRLFHAFDHNAHKENLIKYLCMKLSGGLFVSLHYVPNSKTADNLEILQKLDRDIFLAEERLYFDEMAYSVDFMFSKPDLEFWDEVLHTLKNESNMVSKTFHYYDLIRTGQRHLYQQTIKQNPDVLVLPEAWIKQNMFEQLTQNQAEDNILQYGNMFYQHKTTVMLVLFACMLSLLVLYFLMRRRA